MPGSTHKPTEEVRYEVVGHEVTDADRRIEDFRNRSNAYSRRVHEVATGGGFTRHVMSITIGQLMSGTSILVLLVAALLVTGAIYR